MSVRFPLSFFSVEQKKQISKELHLSHAKFSGKGRPPTITNVNFFQIKDEELILPFWYASNLLNNPRPNHHLVKEKSGPFIMNPNFQPRDYQREALKYAFEDLQSRSTVFYNVYCSFGKTVNGMILASWVAQNTQTATLILAHLSAIVKGWLGTAKNMTNARVAIAGQETTETQIIICPCHQADKLSPETLKRIGLLIVDEADCYCTGGYVATLLATQPYYIATMTATYERDDGMETMLDMLVGLTRIVKISSKPFFVLKIETPFEAHDVARSKYGIQYADLMKKLCHQPERNQLILNIIQNNLAEKILVLTVHKEHASILFQGMSIFFRQHGILVSRYFDKDESYLDSHILVGTFAKIGRGFDQSNACHNWDGRRFELLFLASSTLKPEQLSGRVFRADVPAVIDFVDKHPNCQRHWKERYKWYTSRNGIVKNITQMFNWKELFNSPEYQTEYQTAKVRDADNPICPVRIIKIPGEKKAEKYQKEEHELDEDEIMKIINQGL